MWPFPKLQDELITIAINPDSLTCSWIQKSSAHAPLHLKAYQRFPFKRLECEASIIFNPTFVRRCIHHFLERNQVPDAFVCMAISGPNIVESLIDLSSASPQPHDFKFPKLKKLIWDYRYLYPSNDGFFSFYVCGITRSLLFQYQLLALSMPLNLIAITTQRMALLEIYKRAQGTAFRTSQFAQQMNQHNQQIHELFSIDMLRRILIIKPTIALNLEQEKIALLTHAGLFMTGRT